MKNRISLLAIIAIVAIIGFGFAACGDDTGGNGTGGNNSGGNTGGTGGNNGGGNNPPQAYDPNATDGTTNIGKTGPGGGIIIYYDKSGFIVTGADSFTANYLEATPVNQATVIGNNEGGLSWAPKASVEGTKGGIGTGRENTRLILEKYADAPAALACKNYDGGDKNDWFLPSIYELKEMYNARNHLGLGNLDNNESFFWSSSALLGYSGNGCAEIIVFATGALNVVSFSHVEDRNNVRAVRAF